MIPIPRIPRIAFAAAVIALLALLAGPIWNGRDQALLGDSYDDGIYLASAKALAQGQGYRVPTMPGQPWAVKYPPLYPLYLSLAWRMQPQLEKALPVASMLQAALLPLFIALLLLTFRQMRFRWPKSFLLTAMMLVALEMTLLGVTLFSDLLFLSFLFASILLMERAVARGSAALAVAAGVIAAAAYLTRTAGLPLLVAAPIYCALRKRPRLGAVFLACALPAAVAWHVWSFTHASAASAGYIHEYLQVIRANGFLPTVVTQLGALSGAVATDTITGSTEALGGLPLQHIFLIAAIAGFIRLGRRRRWPLLFLFTALYVPMLLCWWYHNLPRLILPVWPPLVAGIATEAEHFGRLCAKAMARKWPRAAMAPRWALVAVALLVVFVNARAAWTFVAENVAVRRAQRPQNEIAYRWIRENAEAGDVLLAWKDGLTSLHTGVPASRALFSTLMPRSKDEKALAAPLNSVPAPYQRGLLVLISSDLDGGDARARVNTLRKLGDRVPSARLEYASDAALIYSVPLRPAGVQQAAARP